MDLSRKKDALKDNFWESGMFELIRTGSPEMEAVYDKIPLVARTESAFLLLHRPGRRSKAVGIFVGYAWT